MSKLTQKKRDGAVRVELNISDELNDIALTCRALWKRLPQNEASKLFKYLNETTLVKPTAETLKSLVANIGFLYVMAVDEAIEKQLQATAEAS